MVWRGVAVRRNYDFDLALATPTCARSQKQGRDNGKQPDEFHGTILKTATVLDNHNR
jgi:hypothetical protein